MKSFNIPKSSDRDTNSLRDYILDVKPYHSKLLEITEESVFEDRMKISMIENLKIEEINQNLYDY